MTCLFARLLLQQLLQGRHAKLTDLQTVHDGMLMASRSCLLRGCRHVRRQRHPHLVVMGAAKRNHVAKHIVRKEFAAQLRHGTQHAHHESRLQLPVTLQNACASASSLHVACSYARAARERLATDGADATWACCDPACCSLERPCC